MTGYGIAEEYAPLITEQKRADAVAAREEAAAERHHAAQALIPLQNRLDAIPDEFEPEPDACFYCERTENVVVHPYISGVYPVCDDCLPEHEDMCPEAAALAAE
jgi:hypothetical protein